MRIYNCNILVVANMRFFLRPPLKKMCMKFPDFLKNFCIIFFYRFLMLKKIIAWISKILIGSTLKWFLKLVAVHLEVWFFQCGSVLASIVMLCIFINFIWFSIEIGDIIINCRPSTWHMSENRKTRLTTHPNLPLLKNKVPVEGPVYINFFNLAF